MLSPMRNNLSELTWVRDACRTGEARSLRKERRLSLAEVADPVGVSISALARWERGNRKPQGAAALRYARILRSLQRTDVAS